MMSMGTSRSDSGDRIAVAVRVRPPADDDSEDVVAAFPDSAEISVGMKRFTFDCVFDVNEPQSAVFEKSFRPMIEGCLEGFNVTVIAYGQTGSGKTYTMGTAAESDTNIGPESGIIPRAVELLFARLNERQSEAGQDAEGPFDARVQAQFVELYNEDLRDLLESSVKLGKSQIRIHEGARGDIYLTGVSTRIVQSLEDTLRCLRDGSLARTTASTNMNSSSSRSHAIFSLFVHQRWNIGRADCEKRTAKIHFVDLAGSERMKRTGASGERAREGISINCGLLALGNVISALAANAGSSSSLASGGETSDSGDLVQAKEKARGAHIPYRDSKLTRLLADSLGGNSRTLMIACVSPAGLDRLETVNTLQYANRVKRIRNRVAVNRQLQPASAAEVGALRDRIRDLEAQLAAERLSATSRVPGATPAAAGGAEGSRRAARPLWREWDDCALEADAKAAHLKQLTVRTHLRQQVADRARKLAQLDLSEEASTSISRMEAELLTLNSRRHAAETAHAKAVRRAQMARDRLLRHMHDTTPTLETERQAMRSQLRLATRQAEHCQRMCRYLLAHTGAFQRLFCFTMDLLRREHLLLLGSRAVTSELNQQYSDLLKQFEGRKKVSWGDDAEENRTECSSLSSWTTDSESTAECDEAGVSDGVFQLRQADLHAWLNQCLLQSAEAMPIDDEPHDVTVMYAQKTKRRSGYYTKVRLDDPTPRTSYNLRPRRSGSYTPASDGPSSRGLATPVLGPSVLNRTFDSTAEAPRHQFAETSSPNGALRSARVTSMATLEEEGSEEHRCATTPISLRPSRVLMTATVTKKRKRRTGGGLENSATPRKLFKAGARTVMWNNGLPLPIIASPHWNRREPMRPLAGLGATSSKRRLSNIPRMSVQPAFARRRATLIPQRP